MQATLPRTSRPTSSAGMALAQPFDMCVAQDVVLPVQSALVPGTAISLPMIGAEAISGTVPDRCASRAMLTWCVAHVCSDPSVLLFATAAGCVGCDFLLLLSVHDQCATSFGYGAEDTLAISSLRRLVT